ncbi:YjjG family noncanonical pyrimidine nucleotidase [Geojedonia litorea]|uniref:YjjG family noncanonical pyrimidine nucleotidase n=1 Tax=Geojedonia litorea TaxID=1268269 RepID=A0ABV9N4A5_9FLAO
MITNGIKHVFFDLDHTLWDFDKNSALTFQKIFELHNISVAIQDFLAVYEPINLNYWKLYREEKIDKSNLRYRRLKDTFDHLNFNVEDSIINKLSIDYIEHLSSYNHLFDGTVELLEYLLPKYQLHIITNGFEEVQLKKMTKSNIAQYFKTITNSETAGVKKPNPIIFNHALTAANAFPNESIMIGDNFEADILGALEVGYDAIFFNIRNEVIEPKIKQVKYLLDIKMYL